MKKIILSVFIAIISLFGITSIDYFNNNNIITSTNQSEVDIIKTCPESYSIEYNPKILNQNNIESCVAMSLTYIVEILYDDSVRLSPGFLYGFRLEDHYEGEGMYVDEALDTLINYGIAEYDLFPYMSQYPQLRYKINKDEEFKKSLLESAEKHKITSYQYIDEEDFKEQLMNGNPITITIKIQKFGYYKYKNGYITYPENFDNGYEFHQMTIVGWNEQYGWLCLNSWGKWGINNDGYCYLSYDYPVRSAYVIFK